MDRFHRFDVEFDVAFPQGLVQVGDVAPDNEYQSDRSKPARQRVDEATGKRQFKATFTDPAAMRAKDANVQVTFLADVQPVPTAEEVLPGMRPAVLQGLQVRPKVTGNGEFKSLGWEYYATGFAEASAGAPPAVGKPASTKAPGSGGSTSAGSTSAASGGEGKAA